MLTYTENVPDYNCNAPHYICIASHYYLRGIHMANVLVVDDAAFMRLSLKQILEKNGHTMIAEAANGKEAIIKYAETKPDVTILDITMPEMNGLDALAHIKEQDPSAKVIICSALGQQEQLARAIQLGAKDFIVKPFETDRLVAALNQVLER